MDLGDQAPDFELPDQHGRPVRLSTYAGSGPVAVMFFPYAFSRVCTGELADVQAALPGLASAGCRLLAVSCDPKHSLRAFADRDGLSLPLLSDFWPHGEVAAGFGVLDEERGCARRSTYLLDERRHVRWAVHQQMGLPRDPADLLRAAAATGTRPRRADQLGKD